ncbi:outer membrane lipoprotein (lipocalin) [uncultured spirochete]|jgi:apolipoprotein D and lipocalin family protein|uniref:Outer membrane lipoprotein Blc n=1 Tax=uncultured spirochete TaxID=156406 RepID=A0A3P3XS93_9SPIR|nr:outer membrane lipoprotein (lipocalin) [uncultured spirochete]
MKRTLGFVMTLIIGMAFFSSCATIPNGANVVDHFEKEKYLGKWYEIARFDFSFEKNLNNTTAEYSIRKDGKIDVKNRGYNYVTKKWQEANGKARFRGDDTLAALEVSFFGPFYAAYNVIALDKDYQYALIAGSNLNYLWILSRTKTIPDEVRNEYLMIAKSAGYDVSKLIWVEHDK